MKPTTFKFICKYDKKDKQGECPIYLRIYNYYTLKHVNTKLKIPPRHWNKKKSKIRESHPDHIRLNQYLDDFLASAKQEHKFFEDTASKRLKKETLVSFINQQARVYLNKNQFGSAQKFQTLRNKLIRFAGDNIPLHKIDKKFILDFESYMRQIGNKQNTIADNLKDLRTALNKAVEEGLIPVTPFRESR